MCSAAFSSCMGSRAVELFCVRALDDWSFCLTKQLTTEITVADFTIHTKDSAPAYQPLAESHRLWHRTSYTKPQHAHLKRKET